MPGYARRHQLEGALLYHIYNRSHRGEYVFEKKKDFEHFAGLLRVFKESFELKIYHWVVMSNHFHLCVELKEPRQMSRILSGIQRAYTHYYNGSRKVYGYLWQGRFKSQAINKNEYLKACGRYIERNPVRANIVQEAMEYDYSSAGFYCKGYQDGITVRDPFYEEFGRNQEEKKLNYRKYLGSFDQDEEGSFRRMVRPLGSSAFKVRLIKMGEHYMPRTRGRPRSELSRN